MNATREFPKTCSPRTLVSLLCVIVSLLIGSHVATAQSGSIHGRISDPQNAPVAQAHLRLVNSGGSTVADGRSNAQGSFIISGVTAGVYQLIAESPSFVSVVIDVSFGVAQQREVILQFQQIASARQQLTVVASAPSSLTPDPAQSIIVHDQVLDANPGRPGAPISIPGLPIETASGGIKAPQYFAPGVAGDHGEPIAQFYQIGDFLYPNNLPANAHGNGYADPNFLIAPTIEGVRIDGAAFNVREGNNSIDLAASYVPRQDVTSFIQLTGDYRDADAMAGWAPTSKSGWFAGEVSFGNGFLERLEHRQQYKFNGLRQQDAVGPSLNKVISVSIQRNFTWGALYVSCAQADARDRETGEPVPEAPRMIWDAVGSLYKLPFRLQARGE